MALEQYAVRLTPDERERLSQQIRSGKSIGIASSPGRAFYLKLMRDGPSAPGGDRFGRVQGYGVPRQTAVR